MHWARDAAEANKMCSSSCKSHAPRRGRQGQIARDRRDPTEPGARGRQGIRRPEPDLAEHIVQFGGAATVASLAPAMDMSRRESRDLFTDRLGTALSHVTSLPACRGCAAAPARGVPAGRVAISGANFAVAETGTICVVESEGNGRLCTTLPEVL